MFRACWLSICLAGYNFTSLKRPEMLYVRRAFRSQILRLSKDIVFDFFAYTECFYRHILLSS